MRRAYKVRIVCTMWVIVFSLVAFLAAYLITRRYYEKEEIYIEENYEASENDDTVKTASTPLFLLVNRNGYVVIEYFQSGKIYDETGIRIEDIPTSLQEKINGGIPIDNFEQLYDFLENYSS